MFSKENFNHIPSEYEMSNFINNELWDKFCEFMKSNYNVNPIFEFSKCSLEFGWNIKFKKGSRTLCTVYPRENYFCVMIVIGKKEKEQFENMFHSFCIEIQEIYGDTREFNNQKWLMIDLEDEDKKYEDVKKILNIRASRNTF
jgi:AraC family transcriptional regulator